jgi:hypothetical protein
VTQSPWWYSGDDQDGAGQSQGGEAADHGMHGLPTMDWLAMLGGAQRVVDWAADKVMAPHAGHENPADHPDCLVCKSMLLVGERFLGPFGGERRQMPPRHQPTEITWIPIRD